MFIDTVFCLSPIDGTSTNVPVCRHKVIKKKKNLHVCSDVLRLLEEKCLIQ